MKLIKYLFLLIFGSTLLVNCSDEGLLDETELDQIDTEKVYSDVELTRRVLMDLYARTREVGSGSSGTFSRWESMAQSTTMLDNITDDGTGNGGKSKTLPLVQKMVSAAVAPTANFVAFTNPWTWYYRAIRNANQFIANVDRSPLVDTEKNHAKAEARLLRAMYYHELMRWFGPLVITTDILDPFAFNTTKRENLETTVRFIVAELDAMAVPGVLPETWDDANYGRVTRGVALAYKARTLLYAASPLYKELGTTVTWQEAADAAKAVMDLNVYQLYHDSNPLMSYRRMFNTRVNGESIMQYLRADDNDLYNCFPSEDGWNINREGGTAPSQALIDSYDMLDGTEPVIGYGADKITPVINPASGYNESSPYVGREPRFYQSILYDQATWPLVNAVPNKKLDLSKTTLRWVSGYYLVKYLDERVDHMKSGKTSMNFQMMRYAEVLLNYAEAINEAADNGTNRALAVVQLNAIRSRAGITGTLNATDFTQTTLRKRIQKERRIELCFEEHRFYDIRRWKIANEVLNSPAVGIKKENGQYVRFMMENRIYNTRMDFMPIPLSDVNNCPLIFQNKGY